MTRRTKLIGVAVLIALAGAWFWFRPELLFLDARVSEAFPTAEPADSPAKPLRSGAFQSVAHETRGTATVYELAEGRRVLRLADFATSNGPDVRVYLVAADAVPDHATVSRSEIIELGELKGNIGDQNYEVPSSADLAKYRSVVIWCKRFSVNFGTATLAEVER